MSRDLAVAIYYLTRCWIPTFVVAELIFVIPSEVPVYRDEIEESRLKLEISPFRPDAFGIKTPVEKTN